MSTYTNVIHTELVIAFINIINSGMLSYYTSSEMDGHHIHDESVITGLEIPQTFSETSDDKLIKVMTLSFQWMVRHLYKLLFLFTSIPFHKG